MDKANVLSSVMISIGLKDWAIQALVVVLTTLILSFAVRHLLKRLEAKLERTPTVWDEAVVRALRHPATAFIWIVGIAFAVQIIETKTGATILSAVYPLRDVGVIATFSWLLIRFVRNAESILISERQAKGLEFDRSTFDAIAKLLRLLVILTATLVVLQTLGFSVSGVIAFGGIGGIAVGFAAKDLLANFFGGLMIYLDRPFAVGDWIRSPDRNIEGIVERIGWRLTVIRAFDTRPLYIPNAVFTTITVQNPSRMTNRNISEVIGLRYEDADKMADICREVKTMLLAHPAIDTSQTVIVSFNTFSPSSLDFFIYCLTKTSQWVQFHEEKQEILLRVIEIIHAHGADIAFPTSRVHLSERSTQVGEAEIPDVPGS